jgi:ferredoxin-type protein NapG
MKKRLPLLPQDRRGMLRTTVDRWVGGLMERTEQRLVSTRYLRPPGALPEIAFLAACTRCGDCVPACPAEAIRMVPPSGGLAAGTPFLDVQLQPCAACPDMPCAQACPTDALAVPDAGWAGYRLGELELQPERCITFKGLTCTVCAGVCPVGEAALTIDEGGHPVLRREGCVGCGTCLRACPTMPSSFTLTPAES